MTCIIGFVDDDGSMYMGGDSAGVNGLNMMSRADEKVFQKDNMLFGFTSSFRMGQIIQSCFTIPPYYTDKYSTVYEYLCSTFIDELMKCFKEKGYSKIDNNVQRGGCFLLGYKARIYSIESDFQVGVPVTNYWSVGCGADFALGAMDVLINENTYSPEDMIRTALGTAEKFSAGVRKPFKVIAL